MIMEKGIYLPGYDQIQTIAYSAKFDGLVFARGNWQVRLYDVHPVN